MSALHLLLEGLAPLAQTDASAQKSAADETFKLFGAYSLSDPWFLLLIPAGLLAIAWGRTRAGRSPMSADKQHLHHRLLEIGHSQRRAVLIMWMWAFTIATGAVLVSLFDDPLVWWSLGTMIVVSVVLTFVLPKLHRPRKTGLGDTGLPENADVEGRPGEPVPEP